MQTIILEIVWFLARNYLKGPADCDLDLSHLNSKMWPFCATVALIQVA